MSFCPNWDTRWTATDSFQVLALLAVTVAIMVGWRILEGRFRGCVSPAARPQRWRRWRRWLPMGMVLAGGLLILAGERGLLDSPIGSAGAIAWGVLNLPAIIVISLAANLLGEPLWPRLVLAPAMVWLQWYVLLHRVEAQLCQSRFLSLTGDAADSPNRTNICLMRD